MLIAHNECYNYTDINSSCSRCLNIFPKILIYESNKFEAFCGKLKQKFETKLKYYRPPHCIGKGKLKLFFDLTLQIVTLQFCDDSQNVVLLQYFCANTCQHNEQQIDLSVWYVKRYDEYCLYWNNSNYDLHGTQISTIDSGWMIATSALYSDEVNIIYDAIGSVLVEK